MRLVRISCGVGENFCGQRKMWVSARHGHSRPARWLVLKRQDSASLTAPGHPLLRSSSIRPKHCGDRGLIQKAKPDLTVALLDAIDFSDSGQVAPCVETMSF
jgi:hypothetical protein